MRQQFQLVYYGRFSWEATEDMIPYERSFLYEELKSTKTKESEAREKALNNKK